MTLMLVHYYGDFKVNQCLWLSKDLIGKKSLITVRPHMTGKFNVRIIFL